MQIGMGMGLTAGRRKAGTDLYYSSTVLVVNFTGANGATTFTDISPSARVLSAAGTAQIQSNTLSLGGVNDWVTVPDSAAWALAGDFTVEVFKIVFDTLGGAGTGAKQAIISQWDAFQPASDQRAWSLSYAATTLFFDISTSGTSGTASNLMSYVWAPTLGQEYDIAVSRSGTAWAMYVDGVRVATATSAAVIRAFSTSPLAIGGHSTRADNSPSQEAESLDGSIKAVRITGGVARMTGASYTVPSLPLAA